MEVLGSAHLLIMQISLRRMTRTALQDPNAHKSTQPCTQTPLPRCKLKYLNWPSPQAGCNPMVLTFVLFPSFVLIAHPGRQTTKQS